MATPGTMTYPRRRHNITIGDNVWRAIQVRAAELGIPAGEVIDRAFALVDLCSLSDTGCRELLYGARLLEREPSS